MDKAVSAESADVADVVERSSGKSVKKPARKPLNEWQRRDVARKIAKAAKGVWRLSNDADLLRLSLMAEQMFYEAYRTADAKQSGTLTE